MIDKKGFEFSFGWLFSIVIGIAFITMAMYASVGILKLSDKTNAAESAKEFGILLNPIETGLEEGKKTSIYFQTETRTYFDCNEIGEFGNQKISTSVRSSTDGEWNRPGPAVSFNNKYIFSKNTVEGERFIVFSKGLKLPYKIADLVYIWSEKDSFCFIDAPSEIKKDVKGFDIGEINISDDGNCPKNSTRVCFSKIGCDIDVNLESKTVKKYKRTLYYIDDENSATIYAAIFSDPLIYECQMKRLMRKDSILSNLYLQKTTFLSSRGCNSNLESELSLYTNATAKYNSTIELRQLQDMSSELERRNDALNCKLF